MDARLQMLRRRRSAQGRVDLGALERNGEPLGNALLMTDGEVDQFRERAIAFLQAGQWEKASALLDMLVVLGQGDAETLFLAAGCSDALGHLVNARTQFREALRLAGTDQRDLVDAALEWGRHLVEPGAA
jgi:hypothetical protein